jgi:hypothetical protein
LFTTLVVKSFSNPRRQPDQKGSDARRAGFVIRVGGSCSSDHEHDFREATERNEAGGLFHQAGYPP